MLAAVEVVGSHRVGIDDCALIGETNFLGDHGSPGLRLIQASATAVSSTIVGGNGVGARKDGGAGIRLEDASITLSDCTVVGGNGGTTNICLGVSRFPGNGGNGVDGSGVVASVRAVGTGSILGGLQGTPNPCVGTDGIGVGLGLRSVRLGPRISATASPVAPIVAISEPPHVRMPALLPIGTIVTIATTDTADQSVLLGLDSWNDIITISGVELPFVLTGAATALAFAAPSSAGSTQFSLAVPTASWLLQQPAHVQVATVGNDGQLRLSSGAFGRIL
ncbi:MAG: hypothetical protein IPK26_13185 [Planctomycetes bacterium]|nr:hypothetical protein [Planctomycetota bacterium]